jgi:ankyrin repeat protein
MDSNRKEFLSKFLSKKVCLDTNNNCSFKEPYSELQYLAGNPATGRPFSLEEIEEKEKQYENMCSLSNTEITRCCDPNNPMYDEINSELRDSAKKLYVKKIYENGEHVGYDACHDNLGHGSGCLSTYSEANAHDVCKIFSKKNLDGLGVINGPEDFHKMNDKTFMNLVPDCQHKCDNSNYVPFLQDPLAVNNDKIEERKLIDNVKSDTVESLMVYFNDKSDQSMNKVLTEGYPGNTILHESISHFADNCTNFILNNDQIDFELKNKDGNTPIHLAALQGDSSLTFRLIHLGSTLDTKNFYGDSVLHSAVRSGDLPTVSVVLSQGASVMAKNNLGEIPLHTAIMSDDKDIQIIRQLVNMGSDLLTKNNNKSTIVHSLDLFANTKVNAEIRTFLVNQIFKTNKSNYSSLIERHPELSVVNVVDEKTGEEMDLTDFGNLDKLEIKYPDTRVSNELLYSHKQKFPKKTNIKEGFTNSNKGNKGNKLLEREKVECYSFIYKVSTVFIILLAILVILKLVKKI